MSSWIIYWLEALCNLASVLFFTGIQPYLCWPAHWNWFQLQLGLTGHSPQRSCHQQWFIWLPAGRLSFFWTWRIQLYVEVEFRGVVWPESRGTFMLHIIHDISLAQSWVAMLTKLYDACSAAATPPAADSRELLGCGCRCLALQPSSCCSGFSSSSHSCSCSCSLQPSRPIIK